MTTEMWERETERAWVDLRNGLTRWLAEVPPDETVRIALGWAEDETTEGGAPWVEVCVRGSSVCSTVAGNSDLDPRFHLDDRRGGQLLDLGWSLEDEGGELWRVDDVPASAGVLASVLVATLRDVCGVPAPSFLVTSGYDDDGPLDAGDLPFGLRVEDGDEEAEPAGRELDLTVTVAEGPDELRDLVAAAMVDITGDEVEFDADGDIAVPAGNTVVYVRVEEDSPAVVLFAALLAGVRWTPRVGHTLNDVNGHVRYGRLHFLEDGCVMVEYRIFCRPFVPELLRHAVVGMSLLVDGLDVALQERIGGRTFADHGDGVV